MSSIERRIELDSLTTLHWIGIFLALTTAAIHLVIGATFFPEPGGIMFLLAAGGFVGAIVLLLSNYRRRLLYVIGIPFTGIQIVAWYALNRPTGIADIGLIVAVDKLAQLALIGILITLYRWDW